MPAINTSPARVLAFVCTGDSTIESLALTPGLNPELESGHRLLDALTMVGGGDPSQRWQEMVNRRGSIQGEVDVSLRKGESPSRMLFHATPLHKGMDEGMFLVTLCSGFRAISAGPDEVARSRAVLDTAVDAIITIDTDGIISSVNPATIKMFGYPEADLIGKNISVLMPEPYRDEHDGYIRNYLQTGNARIIGIGRQVVGKKQNGYEFPAHLAVSEFSVRGVLYFTGIIRDLSELERVQKQLMQAERLAAIGQMMTGLAHESRNALQRAQACLDMLSLDLQNNPEQLDLARRATTALQDLHRLYEEVRSYAAPIHLEFRKCDIATIWRKEWDNLSALRAGKQIQLLEADNNPGLSCEIDVHRIEQVFRNVLENAIHTCSADGVITIHCSVIDWQGEPGIRIAVTDNGKGMSDEIADKIFEPFFTTKQKGTGLGMAIAHRIMTAHGGSISAKTIQPCGAEILLIIPSEAAIRNAVRF